MLTRIAVVLLVSLLGWAYQATKPPPPQMCGSPGGPPVTSPRIKLSDGRHLAYRESGVPKDEAKYRILFVHGFGGSKEFTLPASQEIIEDLRIYFLSFDRAGYGDSDPNPKRSVKTEAFDIQELADQLEIGSKFYVIGVSMGGYPAWSCLKYIPHSWHAGVSLVAPVVNYWWPSFPAKLSIEAYRKQLLQDQWTLGIAHYAPQLLYWWMTQKWFPSSAIVEGNPGIFTRKDIEILNKMSKASESPFTEKAQQQGVFESLHRDLMVGFGSWDFDPMDINPPFPWNGDSVHIWQGYEDKLIPFLLQRYVAERLPWVKYHEVSDHGHFFFLNTNFSDVILRALLLGEEPSTLQA